MLLKAAFGAHLFEEGSDESLNSERSMDIAGTVGTNGTGQMTTDIVCLFSPVFKTMELL